MNGEEQFTTFLDTVDSQIQNFVVEINQYLTDKDCKCEIKNAKSGFVVSYILPNTKKTLATFVTRKTGIKLRIYANHIGQYQEFLDTLPEKLKKEFKKASVCKRLINPDDCNPRCVMGYDYMMDNEHYQKCRYMAFMPTLNGENNSYIKTFLDHELSF